MSEELEDGRLIDCPRCGVTGIVDYPALSRTDNKTFICGPCGSDEGIRQSVFKLDPNPQYEWPLSPNEAHRFVMGLSI